jgi:wyosine [tRNA(Phe)-imidazoG37] synthetase (radical SAM superfamily)
LEKTLAYLERALSRAGVLVIETMLVSGVNDGVEQLGEPAAYLAVPTRPPAEKWACPPGRGDAEPAYQIITREVGRAELLTGYKGNAFSITEKSEEDLLRITAAHPMTADAVEALLRRNGDKWATIDHLVRERRLVEP